VSAVHPIQSPAQVLHRLSGLPGGPELLAQARRRGDVALVGGAVRDILLGHWPRELDVTVREDAAGLAHELAASVSPSERAYGEPVEPILHERFGTASVAWRYGRIDIAERRTESYPAPGALPEVRPGSFEEDLRRRDFTVNAIALPLHGAESEGLVSVPGALDDLRGGRLRVLHEASFIDDPTRLLRLARYAGRLGFEIEQHTRELAVQAAAGGALGTVSGGRIGSELWLAAREETGIAAFSDLDALGVLRALGIPAAFDAALAHEADKLLPPDGSRATLLMGLALLAQEETDVFQTMERLESTQEQAQAVFGVAGAAPVIAEHLLERVEGRRRVWFDRTTPEGMAAGGALAARRSPDAIGVLREWLDAERHVRLEIDGNDLLAAGVPEGPEVGLRLLLTLTRKREGKLSGREEELRAALAYDADSFERIETA
jgi:tRNA nucleotidyltransferase (CCA-adding enzyme)